MDIWTALSQIPGIGPLLPYLAAWGAFCLILTPFLPVPTRDSGWYYYVYQVLDWSALHIRNAQTHAMVKLKQKMALVRLAKASAKTTNHS